MEIRGYDNTNNWNSLAVNQSDLVDCDPFIENIFPRDWLTLSKKKDHTY